jgi:hypothetical protein
MQKLHLELNKLHCPLIEGNFFKIKIRWAGRVIDDREAKKEAEKVANRAYRRPSGEK